jgi:hypothetical protein
VRPLDFPSVLVGTGPFGDIKNYDGTHFYISWYPAGLLLENEDVMPSPPTGVDAAKKEMIVDAVRAGITAILPGAAEIFDATGQLSVEGGWVFAYGQERSPTPPRLCTAVIVLASADWVRISQSTPASIRPRPGWRNESRRRWPGSEFRRHRRRDFLAYPKP